MMEEFKKFKKIGRYVYGYEEENKRTKVDERKLKKKKIIKGRGNIISFYIDDLERS